MPLSSEQKIAGSGGLSPYFSQMQFNNYPPKNWGLEGFWQPSTFLRIKRKNARLLQASSEESVACASRDDTRGHRCCNRCLEIQLWLFGGEISQFRTRLTCREMWDACSSLCGRSQFRKRQGLPSVLVLQLAAARLGLVLEWTKK